MRSSPGEEESTPENGLLGRLSDAVTRLVRGEGPPADDSVTKTGERWTLERSRQVETRWRRGTERAACFRFDDGYVGTISYEKRGVTWQLTPGPVSLGSALAAIALYLQYDVTPQFDRHGRPFIALDDGVPCHVFEEIADRPVRYRYLALLLGFNRLSTEFLQ